MKNPYYILAFPDLSQQDRLWIQSIRNEHDIRNRDVVDFHFTLVFAFEGIEEQAVCKHLEKIANAQAQIDFTIRHAIIGSGHKDDTAYIFLVPDEGNAQLALLHDQLYTAELATRLRLDIPFTSHITVATSDDRAASKKLCDALNTQKNHISGSVREVTLCQLIDNKVRLIKSFALNGPAT